MTSELELYWFHNPEPSDKLKLKQQPHSIYLIDDKEGIKYIW